MKLIAILGALYTATLLACGANDHGATGGTLTTNEAQPLTFTREEEKLARDVYDRLGDMDPVFANIESSEQTHMDAVLTLLGRYDLPDPAAGKAAGAFTNQTLQKLHDQLVADGSSSTLAALQVGVTIEELDIRDIEVAKLATSRTDILTTYDDLTRGSRNHLRSFYGKLKGLGGSYVPKYLDAATFQAIVDSPMETGGPNR